MLQDADGHEYESDVFVSSDAQYHYNTDIPADIAPNVTEHAVTVFDVPVQPSAYELVPGWNGEGQSTVVAVNVPDGYTSPPTPRPDPWDTTIFGSSDDDEGGGDGYSGDDGGGSDDPFAGCCKVCRTGKACGDTCISRSYTCHVGPGCACNG